MTYALFVYDTPRSLDALTREQKQAVYDEYAALSEIPGLAGHRLQPPATATTLSLEGGEQSAVAGPLTDSERQLAGFYLLDTDDAGRALEVAARIPAARFGGAVQIQPLVREP